MWIPITLAAATFQILRTARQHELRSVLSTAAAGFVRYAYGAPLAVALSLVLFGVLGRIPFGKFLLMGMLVGAGYGFGAFVWLALNPVPLTVANVANQAIAGVRVGGLLGFGLEAVDFIRSRINGDASHFRRQ